MLPDMPNVTAAGSDNAIVTSKLSSCSNLHLTITIFFSDRMSLIEALSVATNPKSSAWRLLIVLTISAAWFV
jgi:hypothetical protein